MAEVVAYKQHEYRMQGGEMHRRPADREGLPPWDAAWLVLNHGEYVPPPVRQQLAMHHNGSLRFD